MKLSTRARYALRLMVHIARDTSGSKAVSLGRVARATMISRRYLEQLVVGLKRQELVRGVSGRSGGYVLARPPDDITVQEIVEAAIGPINVVDCVLNADECLKAEFCECRWVYLRLNDGIRDVLNGLTLEDLAERRWARDACHELPTDRQACPAPSRTS